MVEVRSLPEILATLDERGCLDGMPFMPEMAVYCGHRFPVHRRVDKVWEYAHGTGMRRVRDAVLLKTLRCDGHSHGGCQAACQLIWKEAWLRPPGAHVSKASGAGHRVDLDACTQVSVDGERRYVCQMTEIIRASTQLSPRDSSHYWRDLRGGNARLAPLLVVLSIRVFNGMHWRLGGAPWPVLKPLDSDSSPHQELGLQPGQLVRVKSKHAIELTLNRKLRNRGLSFGGDMLFCCGGSYRVAARVDRIVDERTGELLVFKTPSITLEGANAMGELLLTPQNEFFFWREIWLEPQPPARGARRHSMTDPFVSVVTPVYNHEPYLEECIRSVLSQSHEDFEYIICNNHSTDRSGEIAADYASKDSRIRVVSPPEFSPQAQNFNFALREISGRSKYCKMLLSDDWMYPDCLRQMIDIAEPNPRIALVSAYRLIEERPDCFGVPVGQSSFPGTEPCRWQLLGTAYPFGSQSTVMYSAEVVRDRAPSFFPENRFFMDVDIAFRILGDADFGFVHQVLTFSRYQPEALTDTASHFNWWPLLHYLMMEQYGRDFLTSQEFEARYDEVTTEMYRGLGEQWLKDRFRFGKKKGFWEFQRKHLGDIGVELRPTLLARGVVTAGLSLLGSPSTFLKKMRNEMSKAA